MPTLIVFWYLKKLEKYDLTFQYNLFTITRSNSKNVYRISPYNLIHFNDSPISNISISLLVVTDLLC